MPRSLRLPDVPIYYLCPHLDFWLPSNIVHAGTNTMNLARLQLPRCALMLVLLLGLGCNRHGPSSNVGPRVTTDAPDEFFDLPGAGPRRLGALLRSEKLDGASLPDGMQGWRILYATSVDDKTPASAVATIFAPTNPPPGPRPVIGWAHPTTGLLQRCMPSLFSAPSAGIPARNRIIKQGWVIVETDYSFTEKGGPHPYLIGQGEARALLDSVRAARQLPELTLDKRLVAWGYSQGGHAVLWSGMIGSSYASDLEILGIAAIAPAANISAILASNIAMDKRFGPYLAFAYSRFYPDVRFEEAVRPEALDAARQIINLCDGFPPEESERIDALVETFEGRALATNSNRALAARIEENTPSDNIKAPLLIVQGLSDTAVPAAATESYVDARCSSGQKLEYWTFAARDHFTILQSNSRFEELLMDWTAARFANEPFVDNCHRKSF